MASIRPLGIKHGHASDSDEEVPSAKRSNTCESRIITEIEQPIAPHPCLMHLAASIHIRAVTMMLGIPGQEYSGPGVNQYLREQGQIAIADPTNYILQISLDGQHLSICALQTNPDGYVSVKRIY